MRLKKNLKNYWKDRNAAEDFYYRNPYLLNPVSTELATSFPFLL